MTLKCSFFPNLKKEFLCDCQPKKANQIWKWHNGSAENFHPKKFCRRRRIPVLSSTKTICWFPCVLFLSCLWQLINLPWEQQTEKGPCTEQKTTKFEGGSFLMQKMSKNLWISCLCSMVQFLCARKKTRSINFIFKMINGPNQKSFLWFCMTLSFKTKVKERRERKWHVYVEKRSDCCPVVRSRVFQWFVCLL